MDTFLQSQFICDYCHKISKGEANFLKHRCKQMERMEMLRTKEGRLLIQTLLHHLSNSLILFLMLEWMIGNNISN